MTDDCKLMVRYLEGNAAALDRLKASFRPGLVDVIRRKMGDYDAVEVLADMTFTHALDRIAEWNPERESISSFLLHIQIGLIAPWLPPIHHVESAAAIAASSNDDYRQRLRHALSA